VVSNTHHRNHIASIDISVQSKVTTVIIVNMGCASSTEVVTNPHTGQQKTQNRLGGAYPGNRRQGNQPYAPPASQFQNGQATAHFVNYGGGNALVLQQGGIAQPQVGATPVKQPEYIQVTLPAGVYGGQTIQVAAPDGRLNEIVVPNGFGPGSTFTVEFADGPAPGPSQDYKYETPVPSSYGNTTAATTTTPPPYVPYVNNNNKNKINSNPPSRVPEAARPAPGPSVDDGFATGFNNPNFVPTAPATAVGYSTDYSSYPSADDAKPVYSQPPQYVSRPY
jgi:hypothetical protein